MTTRVLQAREAEVSCLGAILLDNRAFERVHEVAQAQHFFVPAHRTIVSAMAALHADGQPIDPVTLSGHLEQRKQLEGIGGVDYLITLDQTAATSANIEHHARLVRDAADGRAMLGHLDSLRSLVAEGGAIDTTLATSLQRIQGVVDARPQADAWRSMGEIAEGLATNILARTYDDSNQPARIGGTPLHCRLAPLDQVMGGIYPGEFILVAAPISMGKTALGLQLARDMAVGALDHGQGDVLWFNTEPNSLSDGLVLRCLAAEGSVDSRHLRSAKPLVMDELPRLDAAAKRLAPLPLYFDDGARTAEQIARMVRRWPRPVAAVFVDYIQNVKSEQRFHKANERIKHVTDVLAPLAGPVEKGGRNCRFFCLAQQNPLQPDRNGVVRMPNQDVKLRDSNAPREPATAILCVHRPGYYQKSLDQREAFVVVAKRRDGSTGPVRVRWAREYVRFDAPEAA